MIITIYETKDGSFYFRVEGNIAESLPATLRYRTYKEGKSFQVSLNNHLKYIAADGFNTLVEKLTSIAKEIQETLHHHEQPS